MSWSGFLKFLLGFLIAIALLVGSGVAVALYFVTKLTAPPPRPIFANDKPINKPKPAPVVSKQTATPLPQASPASTSTETPAAALPSPSPAPTESPTATPTETPTPKPLEPGAYRARVVWPNGLIVRNGPGIEAERIGGIGYNQQIVVMAESDDKRWIKIRVEENNEEGWVKSGNVERVADTEPTPAPSQ